MGLPHGVHGQLCLRGRRIILNLGTSAMTIYNATEGDGWDGCSYWFVNSDALKQAIRSLPQGEADPAPAPSAHTEVLNTLYAM